MTSLNEEKESTPPVWIENKDLSSQRFADGSIYLFAVWVTDNRTGKSCWDIDKVRICCDEGYFEMVLGDDPDGEPYGWGLDDVSFYIKLED